MNSYETKHFSIIKNLFSHVQNNVTKLDFFKASIIIFLA